MLRVYTLCASILFLAGCELPPKNQISAGLTTHKPFDTVAVGNEEYVMVTTAVTMQMYVNHDQAAFKRWGAARNVKVSILGPADWDVPAQINTIEEVIGTKPTGLLINGTDPAIAQVINKAVAAGIPTVVYDSIFLVQTGMPFWERIGMRSERCKEKKWLG